MVFVYFVEFDDIGVVKCHANLYLIKKHRGILEGGLVDLLDSPPWSFSALDPTLVHHSIIPLAELLHLFGIYFSNDFIVVVNVFLLDGDEDLLAKGQRTLLLHSSYYTLLLTSMEILNKQTLGFGLRMGDLHRKRG